MAAFQRRLIMPKATTTSLVDKNHHARMRLDYFKPRIWKVLGELEALTSTELLGSLYKRRFERDDLTDRPDLSALYTEELVLFVACSIKILLLESEVQDRPNIETFINSKILYFLLRFELQRTPWGVVVYVNSFVDDKERPDKARFETTDNVLAWHYPNNGLLYNPIRRLQFMRENKKAGLPLFLHPQHCFVCGEPLPDKIQWDRGKERIKEVQVCQAYCSGQERSRIRGDIQRALKLKPVSDVPLSEAEAVDFAAYSHIAHLLKTIPYCPVFKEPEPSFLEENNNESPPSMNWYRLGLLGYSLRGIPECLDPRLKGKRISLYSPLPEGVFRVDQLEEPFYIEDKVDSEK
jgi:hypothetical protein